MPAKTLYFDESGYTGYNLLDPEQPTFAIASTDLEPELAGAMLRESFPNYQGEEFKFSNIWRGRNRRGLIDLSRRLASAEERSFCWFIDKRYCVLTKIVDFLIEPFFTHGGYDFYADGFSWKYTNYIQFGLQQFAPPEFHERLLSAYQRFSRNPTEEELRRLQRVLHGLKTSAPAELEVFLDQMELGANMFTEFNHLPSFRDSSETQVTSMLAVVGHWRERYTEDFIAVHDATANFFRRQELWERMTSADVPRQTMRTSSGGQVEFPLRVVSTTPIDSRENLSVQFCDVLAGLTTRIFDKRVTGDEREFANDVLRAGLGESLVNGIRFELVFPDQIPPRPRTGPDNPDRMAGIIFGPHHAHRPNTED